MNNNDATAEVLALLIERMGFAVQTALDGWEAIGRVESFQPGLVLMAPSIPHRDGLEAARRIRLQLRGRRLPLIALTGWGQDSDRGRARAADFDPHLVKPVGSDDLQRAIVRTLESGASANAE